MTAPVDFAAITERQRGVWSAGDYGRVGSLITWLGEHLVRELDVRPGERVLDVAGGNGNASLPAARRFADVLTTDYVPALLEEAQARAAADGLVLRTQEADAQALPFPDGSFDVVVSTIGAMFAPDQDAVARELLRVCRPGGRIGMANWTPDSMVGDLFRVVAQYVPPPAGVRPAVEWGDEARVRELLEPGCQELRVTRRTCPMRFPSEQAYADYFRTWYGPTVAAFRAAGEAQGPALERDFLDLLRRHNLSTDGTLAMEVAYLEVVGVRA